MKITGSHIFIAILIIILAFTIFGRSQLSKIMGDTQDVIEVLVEKEKELSQGIKDSLALIPIYKAKIDSLDIELEDSKIRIAMIQVEHEQEIIVITNNTITEDVEYFAEYIEADTLPRIIPVDNRIYVALIPGHLKRTNQIFAGHSALTAERIELVSQINIHELKINEQRKEIHTLVAIHTSQDERYLINMETIENKDILISLQKKKKRRRTWGMIGAGLIGFGIGALLSE